MTATADDADVVDPPADAAPRTRVLIRWLTRLVLLGVLGLSVVGYLAGPVWADDGFYIRVFHWGADLVSNLRLQYVLVALVALVAGAFMRDRIVIGLAAIIVAVNVMPMTSLFFGSQLPPDPDADTLRVASFNVYHRNDDLDGVRRLLLGTGADVIFLHELVPPLREYLGENLDGYEYAMEDGWGFASGVGAMVRTGMEVEATTVRVGPLSRFPSIRMEFEGRTLDLIGIHPVSPVRPGRAHLRDLVMIEMADWVEERPGEVVLAGDINASPFSSAYRDFVEASGMRSSIDGYGWQATWPAIPRLLAIPIDHMFLTEGLTTVNREIGGRASSDHSVLIADITLAG
jgi:endonuclease/exonuclease/phosphatase (EEP) superfamily protein YafD